MLYRSSDDRAVSFSFGGPATGTGAVSASEQATGTLAASGTGPASGGLVAVGATGPEQGGVLAVSLCDATAPTAVEPSDPIPRACL